MDIRTDVQVVTAKMAAKWMEKNISNRPISMNVVRRFANIMRDGDWSVSNDAIVFADNGELINGQHRLMAIIMSDTEQMMTVIWGLPAEAFEIMDVGKKRQAHDVLGIKGYRNTSALASLAKLVYAYKKCGKLLPSTATYPCENYKILRTVEEHPDLAESVKFAQRFGKGLTRLRIQVTLFAFMHYVYSKEFPEKAEEFLTAVATGLNLRRGDPAKVLYDRYFTAATMGRSIVRREGIALFVRTMNYHIEGKKIKSVAVKINDARLYPQPVGDLTKPENF